MGVGMTLGEGAGDPEPAGAGVPGACGEGDGVIGGLLAAGAGGLTCGRAAMADAQTHPATKIAAKSEARALTR